MKKEQIQTIIIRCPNWVGDVVMATPVFSCVRENFPKAKIIACIKKYTQGVITDSPWFDEIIFCDDKSLKGLIKISKSIKKLSPDIAILLTNSMRSYLEMKLAGIPQIYGYKRGIHKFFLTDGPTPIKENNKIKVIPMVTSYLNICEYIDLNIPKSMNLSLFMSDKLQKEANELLIKYNIKDSDKVIGINPGAKFGSSKCWSPEYFAKLAELIKGKIDCKLLLFVGPGEEHLADNICKKSAVKIINTANDKINLELLKPMIKRCNLLITNDTGPRHYAVAFDIPIIVIFGSTNPEYTNANIDKTTIVRIENLDCSPCHKKICPTNHKCMKDITPEMVFDAVNKKNF